MLEIITITKDDYDAICQTVSSTRELRLRDVEQTVVDGSRQEVSDRIAQFLADEVNVRHVRQEPCGIASAFNAGLGGCRSEWVWFLNGGDLVHPGLDAPLLVSILKSSRSDAIIFDMEMMQTAARTRHPPLWGVWPPLYWVPHPSTLVRRRLFEMHGEFDPDFRIAMDGEMWVRLFSKETLVDLISIPISVYDQNGVSNTHLAQVQREADMIVNRSFPLLFRIWLERGSYLFKAVRRRFFRRRVHSRSNPR